MAADPFVLLGDRKHDHEFCRAMVELIDRDDERRPAPTLLVADRITEIDIPDIAPGRLARGHYSADPSLRAVSHSSLSANSSSHRDLFSRSWANEALSSSRNVCRS